MDFLLVLENEFLYQTELNIFMEFMIGLSSDTVFQCIQNWKKYNMNSMKLVIPLHSLYWSIHTKDESKHGTAFAFIFGVNWLWRCGVTPSFGVFFLEIKCNRMTIFMEFMSKHWRNATSLKKPFYPVEIGSLFSHIHVYIFCDIFTLESNSLKVSLDWVTSRIISQLGAIFRMKLAVCYVLHHFHCK